MPAGRETIMTILSVHNQVVHPTLNYENPDPDCDLDFVPNKSRDLSMEYALPNSFGFGGTNGSILFKKFTG